MITVVDGENAVQLAGSIMPDIILMDVGLPGISGWQATALIKANPDTQHIPIVALTAHAMSADRQQAIKAGCDAFETKPIELDRLLEAISRLVTISRQET